ncbi:hypothetical protein K493DRAFT_315799 [Basidiobolus meristosporus CBS 931.73]|uniref:Transmembrane protein 188 n=1 Tax=Basidiobolus meristosporus CBS 931.73 TaxID=1314790 RepID=A0A1Y1Y785_9FUNG|nr:hypothetical protein K493DRAFT_315799 [Basidiobolus meristosporus CBS 931.73]|eukprot:ORX93829.1 hypothetical protein K493DRAFT_315799 [Basidiobolus meristosporus CBS 931.73]
MALRRTLTTPNSEELTEKLIVSTPLLNATSVDNPESITETTRFSDLAIFEERLKTHKQLLKRERRRVESLFLVLVLAVAYFATAIIFYPSKGESSPPNATWHLVNKVSLVLTGLLSLYVYHNDRRNNENRFIPQCNRVLETYGLQLQDKSEELSFSQYTPYSLQLGYEDYKQTLRMRRATKI